MRDDEPLNTFGTIALFGMIAAVLILVTALEAMSQFLSRPSPPEVPAETLQPPVIELPPAQETLPIDAGSPESMRWPSSIERKQRRDSCACRPRTATPNVCERPCGGRPILIQELHPILKELKTSLSN